MSKITLRTVYGKKNNKKSFSEFLNTDKSVTIHKKTQYLFIKIYNVKKGVSPIIMNEIEKWCPSSNQKFKHSFLEL